MALGVLSPLCPPCYEVLVVVAAQARRADDITGLDDGHISLATNWTAHGVATRHAATRGHRRATEPNNWTIPAVSAASVTAIPGGAQRLEGLRQHRAAGRRILRRGA